MAAKQKVKRSMWTSGIKNHGDKPCRVFLEDPEATGSQRCLPMLILVNLCWHNQDPRHAPNAILNLDPNMASRTSTLI